MITDINLNFDTDVAITATAASTNTIDLGAARDLGPTEPLTISCIVNTAFAGGTSLQVTLQGSTDNATFTTLVSGEVVPLASLLEGAEIANFDIPNVAPIGIGPYRYLRVDYVVVGTMTAGAVTTSLVQNKSEVYNYPSGYPSPAYTNTTFVAG